MGSSRAGVEAEERPQVKTMQGRVTDRFAPPGQCTWTRAFVSSHAFIGVEGECGFLRGRWGHFGCWVGSMAQDLYESSREVGSVQKLRDYALKREDVSGLRSSGSSPPGHHINRSTGGNKRPTGLGVRLAISRQVRSARGWS